MYIGTHYRCLPKDVTSGKAEESDSYAAVDLEHQPNSQSLTNIRHSDNQTHLCIHHRNGKGIFNRPLIGQQRGWNNRNDGFDIKVLLLGSFDSRYCIRLCLT